MTRKKKTTNASAQEESATAASEGTTEEVKGAEIETTLEAGPPLQSKISYIPDEGQTYSTEQSYTVEVESAQAA